MLDWACRARRELGGQKQSERADSENCKPGLDMRDQGQSG